MKRKKKRQYRKEIDQGIATMIEDDGELQIMTEEFTKETDRIDTYLKRLSMNQMIVYAKICKFWTSSLIVLYDLNKIGTKRANKTINFIKQKMWKLINHINEIVD